MLKHIALTVTDSKELNNFYEDILGFKSVRTFELNEDLAQKIFGISKKLTVHHLQREDLILEIFLSPVLVNHQYSHICLALINRDAVYQLAVDKGYDCISIERDVSNMIFVKDKSGNLFELKSV